MIRKGRFMCMNPDCKDRYQERDKSDALFCVKDIVLRINNHIASVKPSSTTDADVQPLSYEDDMQSDMSGIGSFSDSGMIEAKSVDLFFLLKNDKIQKPEIVPQPGVELKSVELCGGQHLTGQSRQFFVNCQFEFYGQKCDPIVRIATDASLYCPKCKKKLPWHMGFCDCYIIMPVGDKDYGKTTFLQEAYALAHDGKMKIGDYSVLAGKKVGDSEGNHKDEGDWTWDNLKMSLRAKGKIPTTDKNEDIFAYFVVKHMSTNEEILWIFRDNPGEILSQPPSDSKLRAFVREVDAFLFFSYPYAFSQIKHQWDSVSERLLKNMKRDFNKEASGSSSTNDDMYNKTYNLLDVTKSDLNNKAGMFVLTMTDKLLEKDNSGRTVIDDLEFENIHISSHSPMFQTGKPFNLRNYYQCAFETAYLLSDEEQFYKQFMSLNDTWKLGTTAISALRNHTQKINYVFGWLIVCLLESDGDGRHFQKPLYEQSADDFRQNPLY